MTYDFYENDLYIGTYDLKSKSDAQSKAIELTVLLSQSIEQPIVTFKEADNGKEKII